MQRAGLRCPIAIETDNLSLRDRFQLTEIVDLTIECQYIAVVSSSPWAGDRQG